MARYEVTLFVDIDEDALAQHNGDEGPPPNDVREWYGSDLFLAYDKGLVEADYDQLEFVKRIG